MRQKVSGEAIERFMKALGRTAKTGARIYFVGGVSAVLLGWRESTIDIDLKLVPEANEILKALPDLKERLQINVELASPDDFISHADHSPTRYREVVLTRSKFDY